MPRAIISPIKPIPDGATIEERIKMLEEHKAELIRLNPTFFNHDGSLKSSRQLFLGMFK